MYKLVHEHYVNAEIRLGEDDYHVDVITELKKSSFEYYCDSKLSGFVLDEFRIGGRLYFSVLSKLNFSHNKVVKTGNVLERFYIEK